MSLAASVDKDRFSYDGFNLYVEVAGGTRHARFSVAQLEVLFYPNNKQSENATVQSIQARTNHWYEAQLIHYGLPASEDEGVCKTRLLRALNEKTLEVPAPIKELEEALENEFNVKNHKGEAEDKVASTNIKLDASGSTKRKHDSLDVTTSAGTAAVSLSIPKKKKKLASGKAVVASDEVQQETDFKEDVEKPSPPAQSSAGPSTSFPPLDHVEGVYDIRGDMSSEATLTLTLQIDELWGEFNLGHSSGIINFPQRPYWPSDRPTVGSWYPHPQDGVQGGQVLVYFTGNGHIRGCFRGGSFLRGPIAFQGLRRPGPPHTLRRPDSYEKEWNELLGLDGSEVKVEEDNEEVEEDNEEVEEDEEVEENDGEAEEDDGEAEEDDD